MKFKSFTVLLAFLVPLTFASADQIKVQVRSNVSVMPTKEVKETVGIKASTSAERVEERRDNIRDNLITIAKNKLSKMTERFEATIDRYGMITSKIISRIEKVKSNGGNTAEAERNVDEAKNYFDKARTALVSLKNSSTSAEILVDASIGTSTAIKTRFKIIKDLSDTFIKNVKAGHESLTKAVKSLKGMSSVNSTTTIKVTN
jgi:hypothetical protein